jgi:DNA adenine methylase
MTDRNKNKPVMRLKHFTPLRYPGGKGKLAAYVKEIIEANGLADGEYIEPYAGGAAIALELLFQKYVSKIRINDVSVHVYSFWKSVLNDTEELCRRVKNTRMTVAAWDRQKRIFANPADFKELYGDFSSITYNVGYTAREQRIGREVMFFSPSLSIPGLVGPVQQVGRIKRAA